jgi:hypothetical protein
MRWSLPFLERALAATMGFIKLLGWRRAEPARSKGERS